MWADLQTARPAPLLAPLGGAAVARPLPYTVVADWLDRHAIRGALRRLLANLAAQFDALYLEHQARRRAAGDDEEAER